MVNFNLSDVYSLGLTALRMLTDDKKDKWNNNLKHLQLRMEKIINKNVIDLGLKQLLSKMIVVDLSKRANIQELRKFFRKDGTYIPDE